MFLYNRAQVKAKLDKLDDAILDYHAANEHLTDTNYKFNALFNRGNCLRRKGDLDDSIKDLIGAV